jgi:hypothetical protein
VKTALRFGLLLFWGAVGCLLIVGLAYTSLTTYEAFTTTLLRQVHKLDWRAYFQTAVLPQQRYALLPYWLGFGAFLWLLLSPRYCRNSGRWSRLLAVFIKTSAQQQLQFWRRRERSEVFFLVVIIGAAALRMIHYTTRYALQYDEAWTYNHFVSNGILVSAVSPNNNHILYTLLACLTDALPIAGSYSLRLPVLLGGLLLLLVFYPLVRRAGNRNWALLSLTFLAFAPAASLYSLYARGYIFQLLFTVLAVQASWQLQQAKSKKRQHWGTWIGALTVGLYSVPTQVYVWVALSGYLLWKGRTSTAFLKAWTWANASVLLLTALLYAPYFITNGSRVLLEAAQASNSGFSWSYQDKVADWLLWGGGRGTPVYVLWLGIWAGLVLLYVNNKIGAAQRVLAELVGLFLLLPTVLNAVLGTQPPYRIWCFLSPFLALALLLIGQAVLPRWAGKKSLLLAIIVAISLYSWRLERHYALQWSAQLDWQVKAIATILLEEQVENCYLFSNYDKPLLEYYYLRQGQRLNSYMVDKASKHYAPFQQLPLYEAVLWDSEDHEASPEERAWLERYYPIVRYRDARVQLHLPAQ